MKRFKVLPPYLRTADLIIAVSPEEYCAFTFFFEFTLIKFYSTGQQDTLILQINGLPVYFTMRKTSRYTRRIILKQQDHMRVAP